jgi:hypothetical protein
MGRRIARRVALMTWPQKLSASAVAAQTLATKVFDCLLQSFPVRRRADRRCGLRKAVWSVCCTEGIRWLPLGGGARRVEWRGEPPSTPFTAPALVTNDGVNENQR